MCGIFGMAIEDNIQATTVFGKDTPDRLRNVIIKMAELSQTRGPQAFGLMVYNKGVAPLSEEVVMYKSPGPSRSLLLRPESKTVLGSIDTNTRVIIGHTRQMTKGHFGNNKNNHPIKSGHVIGVHNGVIQNDEELWTSSGDLKDRNGLVDSEIIFHLINIYSARHNYEIQKAIYMTSTKLEGGYACGMIHLKKPRYLWLFTNSLPIFVYSTQGAGFKIFASEKDIVREAIKDGAKIGFFDNRIISIPAKNGLRIDTATGKIWEFLLYSAAGNYEGGLP